MKIKTTAIVDKLNASGFRVNGKEAICYSGSGITVIRWGPFDPKSKSEDQPYIVRAAGKFTNQHKKSRPPHASLELLAKIEEFAA
jgi:hypothetical protein